MAREEDIRVQVLTSRQSKPGRQPPTYGKGQITIKVSLCVPKGMPIKAGGAQF